MSSRVPEGIETHLRNSVTPPNVLSDAKTRKDLSQPIALWWSWEKKKSVLLGLLKMDFLDWGNDLASELTDIKATTTAYLTEIAVLAALIFTVQVAFLVEPGDGGSFPDETWLISLYTAVWATASFVTLCSVLACVALLVLLTKIPDKNEMHDPAKYFMIRLGLTGRLPLVLFVVGVLVLSPVGCFLWLFTAIDWKAALCISLANAVIAAVLSIGSGLTMVGALYDTLKAIRSDSIPSSAQMRMRLGTL